MSLCLLTSLFGVLMVYSATYSSLEDGSLISRTALVMLLAVIVGVAMCIVISFIDYEIVLRFWMIIGGVCLLMMLLLFPFGSGTADRPDARTWFDFKVINFQPSELFKIAFIITFAVHLDYVGEDINKLKNALLLCVHGGVPALLVILTGDLGSALVFVSILIGMMFASGLAARSATSRKVVFLPYMPRASLTRRFIRNISSSSSKASTPSAAEDFSDEGFSKVRIPSRTQSPSMTVI